MPIYYIDPQNGLDSNSGLTPELPKQTYLNVRTSIGAGGKALFKSGSIVRESIQFASRQEVTTYGGSEPFIIDCENTRSTGIDVNGQTGSFVHNFVVRNIVTAEGYGVKPASRTVIRNFRVENFDGYGIRQDGGSNIVLENFKLVNVGRYGVRINGAQNVRISKFVMSGKNRQPAFTTGIEVTGNSAGTSITRGQIHSLSGDGIMLRKTSSVNVSSCVVGPDVYDGIALEGSSLCRVVHCIVRGPMVDKNKPCLKVGNDFGTGSPSDNNIIMNNIFIAVLSNTCAAAGGVGAASIGTNNKINSNVYINPNSNFIWANWNDGTIVDNGVTMAEFKTMGYEAKGQVFKTLNEAGLSYDGVSLVGSSVIGIGEYVGEFLDLVGSKYIFPYTPGPYSTRSRIKLTRG